MKKEREGVGGKGWERRRKEEREEEKRKGREKSGNSVHSLIMG